jgi:ribosomal protein S18 acetylase RimI-like enzyme
VARSYTGLMLTTRRAAETDAELIAAHRYAMFAEMGKSEAQALDAMKRNFVPWVERMIGADKYVGWIVDGNERPIASAGFFELEWPPHPLDPAGEHRGYLLNFWVEPAFRRRGLARALLRTAVAESKRRGLRVTALHASPAGRLVYEQEGFRDSGEMFFIDKSAR